MADPQHHSYNTNGFVDVHCHVLPGLDDGSPDLQTSLDLLQLAADEGVSVVVGTPHTSAGRFTPKKKLAGMAGELQTAADARGIPVRIEVGMEFRLCPEFAELLESGEDVGLGRGNRHVLVELPWQEIPVYTKDLIFRIRLAGATPVLAHPERHDYLQSRPNLIEELVDLGCLIQLTCSSIVGEEGRRAAALAKHLLQSGLAHVIASDAHRFDHRLFHFRAANEYLVGLLGEDRADEMTRRRPAELIGARG